MRPGRPAPALDVPLVGGGRFALDEARAASAYTLLEIYRGHHCGICRTHLRALAAMRPDLASHGCRLVAVSMNDRELAERAVEEWALDGLDVGYDLTEAAARAWGLFLSDRYRETEPPRFAEPATFLVQRDGLLYAADVRSSPHLRPQLDRLLTMVRRAEEGYPPRGAA